MYKPRPKTIAEINKDQYDTAEKSRIPRRTTEKMKSVERSGRKSSCDWVPFSQPLP